MNALPAQLREVAEIIGLAATLRLIEARPGERVFVPSHVATDHWLAVAIGVPAARALSDRMAGVQLVLPTSAYRGARGARRACDDALASGATINEAVRASGLTHRAVQWRKANKLFPPRHAGPALPAPPRPQADLFDD